MIDLLQNVKSTKDVGTISQLYLGTLNGLLDFNKPLLWMDSFLYLRDTF